MAYVSVAQIVRRVRLLLNEQLNAIEIQEALDQVVRERFTGHQWSFAKDTFYLNTTAEKSAGTVAATQGSATITGAGTAFDVTLDVGKTFYGTDGEPYEISAVASATSLTLASPYAGANVTAGKYAIRQAVYTLDPNVEEVLIMGGNEWQMFEAFDESLMAVDVDQQITGQPYYWSYVNLNASGSIQVRFFPVPTVVQRVPYIGLLRGTAASRDQNFSHMLFGVLVNGAAGLGAMMIAARKEEAGQIRKWQQQSDFYHSKFALTFQELKSRDLDLYGQDEGGQGSLQYLFQDDPSIDLGPFYN